MTEDDERPDLPEHLRRPPGKVLSANQLVSYNLMRARREAGWSQNEVAELLEKYTGRGWSNASVSAAERAWQGGRPRRFDASEIVAFSRMFDQPIPYFFLPPERERYWAKWVGMREFNDGIPDSESIADAMALVATDELVKSLSMGSVSQRLELRISELTLAWLGLTWERPELRSPIREIRSMDELWEERQSDGTEWSEVVRARVETDDGDVVEVTVTPEQVSNTLDRIMGDVKQSVLQQLLYQAKNPSPEGPAPRHGGSEKRRESPAPRREVAAKDAQRLARRLLDAPEGGS